MRLLLLVDNILVAELASIYVLITLTIIINPEGLEWHDILLFVVIPISVHLQSVNFRGLLIHVKWNKKQVVIYKLALLLMTIFFLGHGCYFFTVDFQFTRGRN